jgi:uncharacterized protein (TIGR02757 family)
LIFAMMKTPARVSHAEPRNRGEDEDAESCSPRPRASARESDAIPSCGRQALRPLLDRLCLEFDPRHISPDPIEIVHEYADPGDQEAAALVAAALAYGNVRHILRSVRSALAALGPHPREAARKLTEREAIELLRDFRHRFNSGMDVARLVLAIGWALREHGSLESLFLEGYSPGDPHVGPALDAFASRLAATRLPAVDRRETRLGLVSRARFLLPRPRDGSACKRLNLFLRWMVRGPDGVDLGLWRRVSRAQLVMPLDTHVWRICRQLGLTRRSSPDWRAALEITAVFREFAPQDPVRYDFAISRLGILRRCGPRESTSRCGECVLREVCVRETGAPPGSSRGAAAHRTRKGCGGAVSRTRKA